MAFDASKNLIPVPLHIYTRITAPAPRALKIPKCRHGGFNRVRLRNVTYLTFCYEMEKLNRPLVIDRREMEIAWAGFLLKFFRLWEGDEQARIRKGKRLEEGEPTWKDQWEALKTAFRDVGFCFSVLGACLLARLRCFSRTLMLRSVIIRSRERLLKEDASE